MTIYREVSVTLDQRDALGDLGELLSRLDGLGVRGLDRFACTVQDLVERWNESAATESTFPHAKIHQHIDEIVGVL